ncbi:MAG: c-type cytochrome [Saprospiraceae bacterium]|nr:c-type cytochrome [Bacteroidia bacterium]MBT8230668.1 c-type cytochrome [Bacteroidia bacterium]NNF20361.1 c-type cytochrome [Saprospiraceae bacterium]
MYRYTLILAIAFAFMLQSCQQPGGNSPGSEFMPDMGHSVAYEANYYNYYYNNTWGSEDEYYDFAKPKKPVVGTVPRTSSANISIPSDVHVTAYEYEDSEEGRTRAMNEIIDNPYEITDASIANGKELYNLYCSICHGDKGDGNGYLVRDDGGVYPVQPANFLNDEFLAASNGRYYHSIMVGRNLMGSYKDKLNTKERWDVIHYIRSLQAKKLKLAYNQYENTLNAVDRPAGDIVVEEEPAHDEMEESHDHHGEDHDGDTDHGSDGHDSDHDHNENH